MKENFQIIISPAKKMVVDTDSLPHRDLPYFVRDAEYLLSCMQEQTPKQLRAIWKCNEKLAAQNQERVDYMNLYGKLTPAILSYEGIQYQYMAPAVLEERALSYLQEHLYILSGFYGALRPMDGVTPYRLEMQAKLPVRRPDEKTETTSLYAYWGDRIAGKVCEGTSLILNLASREYSKSIQMHLPKSVTMVTAVFGEEQAGRVIEKGTLAKMARGEMVRFMAERQIEEIEDIRQFDRLGYRYRPRLSSPEQYVFIKSI